jgi:hypothetical protein
VNAKGRLAITPQGMGQDRMGYAPLAESVSRQRATFVMARLILRT